jgi:hypothetical protein
MRTLRFAVVCGMPIRCPFIPTDIHLAREESALCQLQSHLGGFMSVVAPAVRDNFLVLEEFGLHRFDVIHGCAPGAWNMHLCECLPRSRIEEDEIHLSRLDSREDVVALFGRSKLDGKVITIGPNVPFAHCHGRPPFETCSDGARS